MSPTKLKVWAMAVLLGVGAAVSTQHMAGSNDTGLSLPEDPRGNVEKELIQFQHEWAAALINHDRGALGRILAEDFLATDSTGHAWDRERSLAGVAAEVTGLESLESDDFRVRVYADAAVVTFRNVAKCKPGRSDYTGTYRITNTFIRRDGRWRCVATHEGRVVE
jgi:ketosteroid isomerase-like protein